MPPDDVPVPLVPLELPVPLEPLDVPIPLDPLVPEELPPLGVEDEAGVDDDGEPSEAPPHAASARTMATRLDLVMICMRPT